jgi:prepilin-type processing-associated H-X9-DG protein
MVGSVEMGSPAGSSFVACTLAGLTASGEPLRQAFVAKSGSIKPLILGRVEEGGQLLSLQSSLSPDRTTWAAVEFRQTGDRLTMDVHTLDSAGTLKSRRILPPAGVTGGYLAGWSKDGQCLWVAGYRPKSSTHSESIYLGIRRSVGVEEDWQNAPSTDFHDLRAPIDIPGELVVELLAASAKASTKSFRTGAVVLATRDGKDAVALHNGMAQAFLSPRGDAVVLSVPGAILLRKLVQVDLSVLEASKEAAERTERISNAKQVALAALMYASDNGDALPGPDGVKDLLLPYLRHEGVFEGFVYVFAGGPMSAIKNPAETVIGYIPGKNGRAVAYADGHVRWVPDQEPR